MPEIIVKPGEKRIDHPSRDPNYEKNVAVGKKMMEKLQFENEAKKRDYMRAVNANPENIPGLPEYFPALRPTFSMAGVRPQELTDEEKEQAHYESLHRTIIEDLFCHTNTCNRVTPHMINHRSAFCQICGTQKPLRLL